MARRVRDRGDELSPRERRIVPLLSWLWLSVGRRLALLGRSSSARRAVLLPSAGTTSGGSLARQGMRQS